MATLLVVNSSPKSSNSVSRSLTRKFSANWQAANPQGSVVERDLSAGNIPFLNEEWIAAAFTPESQRSSRQKEILALSDQLIDELLTADTILLGVPMHNFSVPAAFKAWIDQIARAGKTFSYSEQGPKGLLPSGKKVVAVITRGGTVASGQAGSDPLAAYLRQVLGFIGLTEVNIIHADRQSMGAEVAARSVEAAVRDIASLAQPQTAPLAA